MFFFPKTKKWRISSTDKTTLVNAILVCEWRTKELGAKILSGLGLLLRRAIGGDDFIEVGTGLHEAKLGGGAIEIVVEFFA